MTTLLWTTALQGAVFTGAALAGCGAAVRPESPPAQVQLLVEPQTARIYTDERYLGSARVLALRPLSFRAGPRRLTITADGYFPHDLDLELAPGTTTVRVELRPIPP